MAGVDTVRRECIASPIREAQAGTQGSAPPGFGGATERRSRFGPGNSVRSHTPAYRDAALGAAAVTRQTVLPTSSATSRAPVLSMATPTGRPRA